MFFIDEKILLHTSLYVISATVVLATVVSLLLYDRYRYNGHSRLLRVWAFSGIATVLVKGLYLYSIFNETNIGVNSLSGIQVVFTSVGYITVVILFYSRIPAFFDYTMPFFAAILACITPNEWYVQYITLAVAICLSVLYTVSNKINIKSPLGFNYFLSVLTVATFMLVLSNSLDAMYLMALFTILLGYLLLLVLVSTEVAKVLEDTSYHSFMKRRLHRIENAEKLDDPLETTLNKLTELRSEFDKSAAH